MLSIVSSLVPYWITEYLAGRQIRKYSSKDGHYIAEEQNQDARYQDNLQMEISGFMFRINFNKPIIPFL